MSQIIDARPTSIGSLPVRRILPFRHRRSVGPFVFLDEMGPVAFPPGEGIDVPPHPHIGLSTLTYMFEGGLDHRDSLGVFQSILPGAVNWMTAGHGVTHSERTCDEFRAAGHRVHGVQAWVALPEDEAGIEPSFEHHPAEDVPEVDLDGAVARIIAGEAFGQGSPVTVHAPLFYVDLEWRRSADVTLDATLGERAVLPIFGEVEAGGATHRPGSLVILDDGADASITGGEGSRALVLGGAALPRAPHMHWNYVAWSEGEIEDAKRRWANGGFPMVEE